MHRTSVKVSAPIDKLEIVKELVDDCDFIYTDPIKGFVEFSFEFPDKPDYLLEQTMDKFNIIKLEEDPRFEHCNLESVKEYPCEA